MTLIFFSFTKCHNYYQGVAINHSQILSLTSLLSSKKITQGDTPTYLFVMLLNTYINLLSNYLHISNTFKYDVLYKTYYIPIAIILYNIDLYTF